MMKLFNTKSNKIEEFKPIKEGIVSMYVCGPTVYDHAHIGNARPIVVFDTLKRLLEEVGYDVLYVSNYTDVDDRIINKAIAENISELEVANRYIEAYEQVRLLYHAINPDYLPRVTETMAEIITFIKQLIEQGFAYERNGDVYFAVDKVKGYGELSHQNIEELQVGARVEENVHKDSPLDFAVWKKTEVGINWESPWSRGRPGWHTECVVMIYQKFNQTTIDIHGGGQDLKFPHHENENAQSCALHDNSLANYWIHNAMVDINDEKMSKSLGNVVWAKDFVEDVGSNVARWVLIQNHYRQTISITDEVIASSTKEIERIKAALKQAALKCQLAGVNHFEKDSTIMAPFIEAMSDDLNTPNAIKEVFELAKKLNSSVRQREVDCSLIATLIGSLEAMLNILGVRFELMLDENQLAKVNRWNLAKSEKDYELADKLRKELMEEGVL